MNRTLLLTTSLLLCAAGIPLLASTAVAVDRKVSGAASQPDTFFSPWLDVSLPDATANAPGQTVVTKAFCQPLRGPGDSVIHGNVTWTWIWLPIGDTDADGRRSIKDACPCAWDLAKVDVQHRIDGQPLEC